MAAAEPEGLAVELAALLADEDEVLTFTRPDEEEAAADVAGEDAAAEVAGAEDDATVSGVADAAVYAGEELDATAEVAAAAEVVPSAPVDESQDGGATAVLGSTSAPVPHGMALPSGCVALGSGTVEPSAPARAKRVVHVGS